MTVRPGAEPVITAWSAISPFGIGAVAFMTGVLETRSTRLPVDQDIWHVPYDYACLVPDFDAKEILGKKGTRALNREMSLAVATTGRLLDGADESALGNGSGKAVENGERTALVLGTTTSSLQSIRDFTRDSLEGARPYFVEPAFIPNVVMNAAAARCAIWHGLKGPNVTVATGRVAAISALTYARRLLLTGRADRVLAGSVEEFSTTRAWLHYQDSDAKDLLGEGCAVFMLEPSASAGGRELARLLGSGFRTCVDGDVATAVRAAVQDALDRGRTAADDVFLACPSGGGTTVERACLAEMIGDTAVSRIPDMTELIADTAAASGAFQIAAVLSIAHARSAEGKPALITSVDPAGSVACVLLSIAGGDNG
jgi:3-oxoacyl-[acyl-carrier-protein] synthase II